MNCNSIDTKIIAAFPGLGKSYLYQNQSELGLSVLDSDSKSFSWLEFDVRNPNFPQNYIEHIKYNIGFFNIICVSTHKAVRQALAREDINYYLAYPCPDTVDKNKYMEMLLARGSSLEFVEMIYNNWEAFIEDIECETFPTKIAVPNGFTLTDIIKNKLL